jgi:hypothetical protein
MERKHSLVFRNVHHGDMMRLIDWRSMIYELMLLMLLNCLFFLCFICSIYKWDSNSYTSCIVKVQHVSILFFSIKFWFNFKHFISIYELYKRVHCAFSIYAYNVPWLGSSPPSSSFFPIYCCDGWGHIVAFTQVLAISKVS